MTYLQKSKKLAHVCYDIRGPVLDHANALEEAGQRIIKLNIGNPAAFGFDAPDEIMSDVIQNLREAQGYCHSRVFLPHAKPLCNALRRRASETWW